MIDSLVELLVALFIAAVPILATIVRSRRKRAAKDPKPRGRTKKRFSSLRNRFKKRQKRSGPSDTEEQTGVAGPARAGSGNRRVPSDSSAESALYRELPERAGSPVASGADRLARKIDRYPPLQKAILLREILGPPKGLE